MCLSRFQSEKCLELVKKLMSWPICRPFLDPVDPERDNATNYYEIIKNPMTLREVEKKLLNKRYRDISDFRRDVNLIWSNAITYNGDSNIFGHFAMEGKIWFNKKMNRFPTTIEEEWMRKMQKVTRKLHDAIAHPPKAIAPVKPAKTEKGDNTEDTNVMEYAIFDE